MYLSFGRCARFSSALIAHICFAIVLSCLGKVFHKGCHRCGSCNKLLANGNWIDSGGKVRPQPCSLIFSSLSHLHFGGIFEERPQSAIGLLTPMSFILSMRLGRPCFLPSKKTDSLIF
jgi:hypothetical protein